MKLYHLYDKLTGEIYGACFFTDGEATDNALLVEPNNFVKPKVNLITLRLEETANLEEIQEQLKQKLKEAEKQKYIQRIKDGQEKYAELSAEFRLAKLSGQIDDQTYSTIEEILVPVRNEVLAGQWMSALSKLETIGSANIGENLYNRLHNDIQTYINNSYTVDEIINRRG